ncbi:methyltransferase-like protein 27 isoform 1-T3 [Hipposideros larvatus]
MAQEEDWSLHEVRGRVGASHGITDLAHKLHFYDRWAPDYDQDVAILQYSAPRLAVDCLTQALSGPPHATLILDVACGTGLVAAELQARGFLQLHGVDGSPGMLEQARARGLYQRLSLCTLGQEPLPSPKGTFDAVLMVGALSDGQVPCSAIPELLRVTKPASSLTHGQLVGESLFPGLSFLICEMELIIEILLCALPCTCLCSREKVHNLPSGLDHQPTVSQEGTRGKRPGPRQAPESHKCSVLRDFREEKFPGLEWG